MKIGIDFGTSYSAAAAFTGENVVPILFDGERQFRTAIFFPDAIPDMTNPERMRAGLKQALFGEAAIDAYLSQHRGHLVQSPKSMLGQRMDTHVRARVFHILSHTLEHIRRTATAQLGTEITAATLGRPVQFRSSMGEAGGAQAQELLASAAKAAGFVEIDFLEEPRAAAFRFHRETPEQHSAMIVDIGGGTSDIAWGSIGGNSAAPEITGSHGEGFGGTDIDIALSLEAFMPSFGRGQPGVPGIRFSQAARISDMPDQAAFLSGNLPKLAEPWFSRLRALQKTFGATTLLNRQVEQAKIALNSQETYAAALTEIDSALAINVTKQHLETALDTPPLWLARLLDLLNESKQRSGTETDLIFLTGGTSRAPYVHAMVRQVFPHARIVQGDASFGVVDGLARYAGMARA